MSVAFASQKDTVQIQKENSPQERLLEHRRVLQGSVAALKEFHAALQLYDSGVAQLATQRGARSALRTHNIPSDISLETLREIFTTTLEEHQRTERARATSNNEYKSMHQALSSEKVDLNKVGAASDYVQKIFSLAEVAHRHEELTNELKERREHLGGIINLYRDAIHKELGITDRAPSWKITRAAQMELQKALGIFGLGKLFNPAGVQLAQDRLDHVTRNSDMLTTLDDLQRKAGWVLNDHYEASRLSWDAARLFGHIEDPASEVVRNLRQASQSPTSSIIAEVLQSLGRADKALPEKERFSTIIAGVLKCAVRDLAKERDGEDAQVLAKAFSLIDATLGAEISGGSTYRGEEPDYRVTSLVGRLTHKNSSRLLPSVSRSLAWAAEGPELSELYAVLSALSQDMVEREVRERERHPMAGGPEPERTYYPSNFRVRAYETKGALAELEPQLPLSDAHTLIWRTLCEDPEVPRLLKALNSKDPGEEIIPYQRLEHADLAFGEMVLGALLVRQEHCDETIALGSQLMERGEIELFPFALLNAFREPGYSGEYPFLAKGSRSIVEKAATLADEELAALKLHPCPEIYSAVISLRKHKEEALRPYLLDSETLERNLLHVELTRHIEDIACFYLKNGSLSEKGFTAAILTTFQNTLRPETVAEINEIFTRSGNSQLKGEFIRCLIQNPRIEIPPTTLGSALQAIAAKHVQGLDDVQSHAAAIFERLPIELQRLQIHQKALASILELPEELFKTFANSRSALVESGLMREESIGISRYHAKERLESGLTLARVDGIAETVQSTLLLMGRSEEQKKAFVAELRHALLADPFCKARSTISQNAFKHLCHAFSVLCERNGKDAKYRSEGRFEDSTFGTVLGALLRIASSEEAIARVDAEISKDPEALFLALHAVNAADDVISFTTPENIEFLKTAFPRHKDTKVLASWGVSLLKSCGWWTGDHLPALANILPVYLREGASTDDAWAAHSTNLRAGKAEFLKEAGVTVEKELQKLLEFRREFPGVRVASLYEAVRCIGEVGCEEKLKSLGLQFTDKRAIHEIKTRIARLRENLLASDGPCEITSPFELDLLVSLIGYGGNPSTVFDRVRHFNRQYSEGKIVPIDERFFNADIAVNTLDMNKVRTFLFSEPTHLKYAQLYHELQDLREQSLHATIKSERERITTSLQSEIREWEKLLQSGATISVGEKKGREIECARNQEVLKRLEGSTALSELLTILCEYKQKDNPISTPAIRRITLRMALDEMSDEAQFFSSLSAEPSKEGLEAVVSLIDQRLKEEALATLTLSPKLRKGIGLSVGTASFQQDLKRLSEIDSAGKEIIRVHPTRGMLGELSGFNCDACWTRESEIMARYPSVTPLMFIRSADDEARKKVVGACILIKAKDKEGNDLFIVRGLNPVQNFITQLDPGSFFENFIDMAIVPFAKAQGVTRIVIPSETSSGSSQTNRPTLNVYIQNHYGGSPVVSLDPNGPISQFNNYSILDKCVLVRKLEG